MKEPDPIPDLFDETHVAVHTLKKVVKSWQKWQILHPYKEFSFNSWSQMNYSGDMDSFKTTFRWVFLFANLDLENAFGSGQDATFL